MVRFTCPFYIQTGKKEELETDGGRDKDIDGIRYEACELSGVIDRQDITKQTDKQDRQTGGIEP